MPRTYTRAELRTKFDQAMDMENSTHMSTAEKDDILNMAWAETWDKICQFGLGEKFTKKVTFNTVANQTEYTFAAIAPALDLYRIEKVAADEGNFQYRPLQRIQPSETFNFRPPTTAVPMVLWYLPSAPIVLTGAGQDGTTFDGINGWEEHTIMTACVRACQKKGDNAAQYIRRKEELEKRMAQAGSIDYGEPPRVSRKRRQLGMVYYPYVSQINAYVVRGDKVELYYTYPWVR